MTSTTPTVNQQRKYGNLVLKEKKVKKDFMKSMSSRGLKIQMEAKSRLSMEVEVDGLEHLF